MQIAAATCAAHWSEKISGSSRGRSIAVGVLSGTSADGIDVALAKGLPERLEITAGETFSYRASTLKVLRRAPDLSLAEAANLHRTIAEEFSGAILKLLKSRKINPRRIEVIGSHGQTVFHSPRKISIQLGAPGIIAARTGIPVAADFRPCDIGVGGEGAPFVPVLDQMILTKCRLCAGALNIGGIANLTVVERGKIVGSWDTGPGNAMIDAAMRKFFGRNFDKGGETAASGKISARLLDKLLRHPYFHRRRPKSTGIEEFGAGWLEKLLENSANSRLSPQDLVATLTEFTARTIAREVESARVKELWISGGGAKNQNLIHRLRTYLPGLKVDGIDQLGVDSDFKEALLFAYLGVCRIRGVALDLCSATGATRKKILGGLWLP